MKILLIAICLSIVLNGCNNNASGKKVEKEAVSEDEPTTTTLVDLSAVTNIKELLCQNWENKEDAEDAIASGGRGSMEVPYRGFSFFKDGKVTVNPRDNISLGKWTLNDATKIIDIDLANGQTKKYKIGAIGAMQLLLVNMADKTKTEYISDAKSQLDPNDDPFYGDNNKWRIKPSKAETDSAIKLRVQQCILFYAKFMTDNVKRTDNRISFIGLPSCFKWYSGGISIMSKEKLEEKWINCFYNEAQAMKAHTMLDNIISKKYKWDKDERNWVSQSADVVRQLHDTLKVTSIAQLYR